MDGTQKAVDETKINNQYQKLLSTFTKSADASGEKVKDNPKGFSGSTKPEKGPMDTELMSFTQMLESMDAITKSIDARHDDIMEQQVEDVPAPTDSAQPTGGDDELINELNRLFTPVLIMQGFENDSSDKIQEAMSEAAVLTEKSIIQFDDDTRMAQLISVCALLIARQKNTEKYQMYAKAHEIKKQMKLDIQKEEYDNAKTLAQKYLVNVSTTNNSPVARNAATALLPATQH